VQEGSFGDSKFIGKKLFWESGSFTSQKVEEIAPMPDQAE
jgi:hypothetical protein